MTATFGDFIDGARAHLEIADRHAHADIHPGISAGIFDAGRSLTAMLARCADDFAGAREVGNPLRHASHLLGRWETDGSSAQHPIPLHLSAAAVAWGAAGDVLATHFSPRRTHARSDWTTVITDQRVRSHLLSEVAGHALALSSILDRTAHAHAADIRAARHLLSSSPMVAAARLDGSAALRVVPLNQPAAPEPIPQVAQTADELRAGITTGAEALRALRYHDTDKGPAEWHRTALAASIITHISARMLTQLTRRAYELNPDRQHDLGQLLQRATDGLDQSHAEWKGVRRAWLRHLRPGPVARSLRQQHLEQVAVRLGRLLYANPMWTPAPHDAAEIKSPQALATSTGAMVPTLRSVLHTFEALIAVTEQDRGDMIRAGKADHLPDGDTSALRTAYEELSTPKVRTSWSISEAIFLAADPDQRPQLWPEVHALELRRSPTAFTQQAARERDGTSRWLEWLSTRTTVSDTRLASAVEPGTTPHTAPPGQRSASAHRGRNRLP
ncbi:hypothetical protein [Microbispora sp. NPDC049125]|uniref:hypothetical protein n=1 Tax=Microbispora sp. NPDC049125 TaxID=3154929 RepID=UPI00346677E5